MEKMTKVPMILQEMTRATSQMTDKNSQPRLIPFLIQLLAQPQIFLRFFRLIKITKTEKLIKKMEKKIKILMIKLNSRSQNWLRKNLEIVY